jgi:peptide/nickel transport system permease protein
MTNFILRRLLATLPVVLIVAVLVFLMLRLMLWVTGDDPAAIMAGDNATTEQIALIRKRLGLEEPFFTQFFSWLWQLLQGDLGESYFFKKTVASLIGERVGPTVSLAFVTLTLAVLVAVPLGVIAARFHGTFIDWIVMGFSVMGFSVPVFVVGYCLIYVFAIELGWLPVQGYKPLSAGVGAWLYQLILPACTLSVISPSLPASRARVCSRCCLRTTFAPRAPRAKPSASSSSATPCATPPCPSSPSSASASHSSSAAPW